MSKSDNTFSRESKLNSKEYQYFQPYMSNTLTTKVLTINRDGAHFLLSSLQDKVTPPHRRAVINSARTSECWLVCAGVSQVHLSLAGRYISNGWQRMTTLSPFRWLYRDCSYIGRERYGSLALDTSTCTTPTAKQQTAVLLVSANKPFNCY